MRDGTSTPPMDESISYLTGSELLDRFEQLSATSEELLVAMAFASLTGVQQFAGKLRSLSGSRPLVFHVILDKNFAPGRATRTHVINELRSLGAEVRILETPAIMHSKLYIFRSGTRVSAVCGSGNLTGAAFEHNIELNNVILDLPDAAKQRLADWFETNWEKSILVHDGNIEVIAGARLEPGCPVSVPALGQAGVIISAPPGQATRPEHYWVRFGPHEILQVHAESLDTVSSFKLGHAEALLVAFRAFMKIDDAVSLIEESRIRVYPHQVAPLLSALSTKMSRILIADEVGLGKTITAGIFLAGQLRLMGARSVLVVCPPDLASKWAYELKKKFGLGFLLLNRSQWKAVTARGLDMSMVHLHIISYDTLRHVASTELNAKYEVVVIDEVHHGRNSGTQTYNAARNVSGQAKSFLGLSATPLQTSPDDLEAVLSIVEPNPGRDKISLQERIALCRAARMFLKNPSGFQELKRIVAGLKHPEVMLERLDRIAQVSDDREKLAKELAGLSTLDGRIFRTTKADLGISLPRRVHNIFIALDHESERQYVDGKDRATKAGSFNGLLWERFFSSSPRIAKDALEKLRDRIDPVPVDSWDFEPTSSEHAAELSRKEAKLISIVTRMRDEGRRAIIFTNFIATSRRLATVMRAQGFRVDQMEGSTPIPIRLGYIESLRSQQIDFLVSTSVGQEGLDLQFIDTVINFDLPWNPMVMEQRIGRVDRLGQKAKEVHVYNFIVYGATRSLETVDKRLMRVLHRRLSEASMHMGDIPPVLDTNDGVLEDDEILRALEAVRRVNEWLPGLNIARFAEYTAFMSRFEQQNLPPRWIVEFVGQFGPILFPGTIVDGEGSFMVVRPSDDLKKAAGRRAMENGGAALPSLIDGVWFFTFDRTVACENAYLEFLTPRNPLVAAIAARFLDFPTKRELPIPDSAYRIHVGLDGVKLSAKGAVDSIDLFYTALAECKAKLETTQ